MELSLHCSIKVNLPGGFDISAQWMRNGSLLPDNNDGRVEVGGLSLISQSSKSVRYIMYLNIDLLSKTLDLGSYSCVRAVYSSTSSYVVHSMSTSTYFLNIQGEDMYAWKIVILVVTMVTMITAFRNSFFRKCLVCFSKSCILTNSFFAYHSNKAEFLPNISVHVDGGKMIKIMYILFLLYMHGLCWIKVVNWCYG